MLNLSNMVSMVLPYVLLYDQNERRFLIGSDNIDKSLCLLGAS